MVFIDESRVERIRFRLDSKIPVWWKRSQYVGKTSSPPRWHSLEKFWREGSGYLWVAKCGYMWKDRALLGRSPEFRHEVKTKKIRCEKCSKAENGASK